MSFILDYWMPSNKDNKDVVDTKSSVETTVKASNTNTTPLAITTTPALVNNQNNTNANTNNTNNTNKPVDVVPEQPKIVFQQPKDKPSNVQVSEIDTKDTKQKETVMDVPTVCGDAKTKTTSSFVPPAPPKTLPKNEKVVTSEAEFERIKAFIENDPSKSDLCLSSLIQPAGLSLEKQEELLQVWSKSAESVIPFHVAKEMILRRRIRALINDIFPAGENDANRLRLLTFEMALRFKPSSEELNFVVKQETNNVVQHSMLAMWVITHENTPEWNTESNSTLRRSLFDLLLGCEIKIKD